MEALTGVSVAALTVYDMVKTVDKTMVIGDIRLIYKEGGKSGKIDFSMIPVADALERILDKTYQRFIEKIFLDNALGRVLATEFKQKFRTRHLQQRRWMDLP